MQGTSYFGTKVAASDAQIFIDALVRAGGAQIDTAQIYGSGASEKVRSFSYIGVYPSLMN